jgi:hypothetical protein
VIDWQRTAGLTSVKPSTIFCFPSCTAGCQLAASLLVLAAGLILAVVPREELQTFKN